MAIFTPLNYTKYLFCIIPQIDFSILYNSLSVCFMYALNAYLVYFFITTAIATLNTSNVTLALKFALFLISFFIIILTLLLRNTHCVYY